jgi:hypothetical protein
MSHQSEVTDEPRWGKRSCLDSTQCKGFPSDSGGDGEQCFCLLSNSTGVVAVCWCGLFYTAGYFRIDTLLCSRRVKACPYLIALIVLALTNQESCHCGRCVLKPVHSLKWPCTEAIFQLSLFELRTKNLSIIPEVLQLYFYHCRILFVIMRFMKTP